jgi:hypothetical protein
MHSHVTTPVQVDMPSPTVLNRDDRKFIRAHDGDDAMVREDVGLSRLRLLHFRQGQPPDLSGSRYQNAANTRAISVEIGGVRADSDPTSCAGHCTINCRRAGQDTISWRCIAAQRHLAFGSVVAAVDSRRPS